MGWGGSDWGVRVKMDGWGCVGVAARVSLFDRCYDGSTACVVLANADTVICANLGD